MDKVKMATKQSEKLRLISQIETSPAAKKIARRHPTWSLQRVLKVALEAKRKIGAA